MILSKRMFACATLVIALFTASSAMAQGGGMRGDTAAMRQAMEARLAKQKTDLNLTQTQADSIKAITMEFRAKRREMMMDPANQGMSREDRMAKMKPMMDQQNARIQAALGADLYKKYQDWEQANPMQRPGGGGGGGNQ
jgi:predicted transglutaminase-like cysteine proteinase